MGTETTAAAQPPSQSSQGDPSIKRTLGFGIIGAGRMGRIHAAILARGAVQGARLVAVSDVLEEPARRMAAEFQVTNVFTDYLRLVENREVDAVIVATPSLIKPQIVKFASEVGKHIFCEAPIASSLHDADQVFRSSQKSAASSRPHTRGASTLCTSGSRRRSTPTWSAPWSS